MIGIIYKFTILPKKRYYVGQYSGKNFNNYWGSGKIWNDELKNVKMKYPTCWKRLVKREILFQGVCNQKTLDKLEEIYIRKERAHYSLKLGGCNILLGTANKFGSGSPMKDSEVVGRCSISNKKYVIEHPDEFKKREEKRLWKLHNTDYKKKISETLKGRYKGEKNPNFGNRWTDEQKKSLSEKMKGRYNGSENPNFGNHWSDEKKRQLSKKLKAKYLIGYINPMEGKIRITNGIINTVILKNDPLPEGFWYGMKRRNKK